MRPVTGVPTAIRWVKIIDVEQKPEIVIHDTRFRQVSQQKLCRCIEVDALDRL